VTLTYVRDSQGFITGGNAPLGDNVAGLGSAVVPDDFTNFTVDLALQGNPRLSVAKTADRDTAHHAGDVVTYSFVVTNAGTTSLNNVLVTDMLTAPAGPELTVTCPRTSLAARRA
jgi:uncharacterized repeat protein (TIGR01451 family)